MNKALLADFKAFLEDYRKAVELHTLQKTAFEISPTFRDSMPNMGEALLARQESRLKAAEIALTSFFTRITDGR